MVDAKQEILSRLSIEDVVAEYVQLRPRGGGRLVGLCPFHTEKTPSFTVTPEKGMYYCFGCHKGGDLFSFVMEIEGMEFRDALRFLGEKAGVDVETGGRRDTSQRDALLELNKRVSNTFAWFLREREEGRFARDYVKGRGFVEDTIESFRLGYAPADPVWLKGFLRQKGYSSEFLSRSGLFRGGADLQPLFRHRLMFPIETARGEVIGFGGRLLGDQGPKYVNSPETEVFRKREQVFGFRQAREHIRSTGVVVIVEGYTDVLAAWQAGVKNCVATLGTAVTEGHGRLLKRACERVVFLLDADEAGQRATRRGIELFEGMGVETGVVEMPSGVDPADFVAEQGAEKLQKKLKSPISSFEYLLDNAIKIHNPASPGGKERVFRSLLPFLSRTTSEVRRDGYLLQLAETLGVDADAVRRDFRRGGPSRGASPSPARPTSSSAPNREMTADLYLMLAVAANRRLYASVRSEVEPDALKDERARAIHVALEECYRAEDWEIGSLLDRLDGDLRRTVMERLASEEFEENAESLVKEAVRKFKQDSLIARRERLTLAVRRYERDDPEKVKELLIEKMILDREIEKLRVSSDVGPAE
jgi:DNA primase